MNFIDFNIEWYKNRLSYYHEMQCKNLVSNDIVHEAKILHKFLDDLSDEGYHTTYDLFQCELQTTERLTTFINLNDDKPFCLQKKAPDYATLIYNQTEKPLSTYLQSLVCQANKINCDNLKPDEISDFLFSEILHFTSWVCDSIRSDTVVIFLLRDTLFPYLAFQFWNKNKAVTAVPLLIGRKFLDQFGDGGEIYNTISDSVYTALHENGKDSLLFQNTAVKIIRKNLKSYQKLNSALKNLLSLVQQKHILLVESGVHGTMPLLLKSVDERISDIKLYTTLPWLYDAWNQSFFSKHYENLRIFETLLCQDVLFQFSSIKDNVFYVQEIESNDIKEKSIQEIGRWKHYLTV